MAELLAFFDKTIHAWQTQDKSKGQTVYNLEGEFRTVIRLLETIPPLHETTRTRLAAAVMDGCNYFGTIDKIKTAFKTFMPWPTNRAAFELIEALGMVKPIPMEEPAEA